MKLALLRQDILSDRIRRVTRFMLCLATPGMAYARAPLAPDDRRVCSDMVDRTEHQLHLPVRLLHSIALVESGRLDPSSGRFAPWPWTINVDGTGYFFEDKATAIAAVQGLEAIGVSSIDIGCLQINLKYHPAAFASLDAAFEPSSNVSYGGRFLFSLYRSMQSWPKATAAYHSMDADRGSDYVRRVAVFWPSLKQETNAVALPASTVASASNETEEFRAWQAQTRADANRVRSLYTKAPDRNLADDDEAVDSDGPAADRVHLGARGN